MKGSKGWFIISTLLAVMFVTVGYYYLNLGTRGYIDFGSMKYSYAHKMFWFFGSITLISAKAFMLPLKSLKHMCVTFMIAWLALFLGFYFSGGIEFSTVQGDYSIGVNVKLIAQASVYILMVAIGAIAFIAIWFSGGTTEFLQTIFKLVLSLGVALGIAYAVVIIPF